MRLIDADALEQKFSETKHYLTKDMVMDAMYEIHKASTIDPVKHGKWVIHYDHFAPYQKCTACGFELPVVATETEEEFFLYSYCPHCGARMDGEA